MLSKSVFARYMVAFTLIILLSFLILALIITSLVQSNSADLNSHELERVSVSAKQFLESVYNGNQAASFTEYIDRNLEMTKMRLTAISSNTSDLFIMVTNRNGLVLICDEATPDEYANLQFSKEFIESVSESKPLQTETNLDGLLSQNHYVYTLALLNGDDIMGYVIACMPSSATMMLVQTMIKMIILACMWVMCAAIIASYFISERIVRPIRNLSKAAKSFAAGQFDVRVQVTGNDEIAELGIAFNNMAASLATLEDTRRTFLANVSHDLRTPMTTIASFIDGILDGAIPPEKHEYYLQIIATEVRRLSRLVNSLLDISRIQAGERKFSMVSFDISELARQVLISFENRINEKKLEVSFESDSDSMYAIADSDAIHQILYNICDNAVKFSFVGGVYRIHIWEQEKKIYVSVYNEGQGIPPEDLPHVFDRFYKSDKSRGLDKTGVGLGMYIAKTIIDAHGETLTVNSKQGEFCEFVFTLKKDSSRKAVREQREEEKNGMTDIK